jgi:hypothetical protein
VAKVWQISVWSPAMMRRFLPVASTAARNASSSKAFIEDRSMGSRPTSSVWMEGTVGPLNPKPTPTVDSTIGIPNALAVLASSRT